MKISIASYAFHGLLKEGKMDLFGYLESCKYRYGLQAADIWNGMLLSTEDDYLAKVRQGLDERELALANLCVDGPHIWEDDPEVREQHYRGALDYLRVAEVLGAETIRIDAGVRAETFTGEQFDWIVKRYREYARHAYDSGYRVGPENHWGAEAVPENMRRICQAVDHPGFGVLLHFRGNAPGSTHAGAGGDALMAPWAMHTHISWAITESYLEESLTMLRDSGYSGYWGVEHHSGKDEYTEVAVMVAKVRDLLSRW
jgi:sugar phosphate isomerase/epimerase